jgi:hypothetical protein
MFRLVDLLALGGVSEKFSEIIRESNVELLFGVFGVNSGDWVYSQDEFVCVKSHGIILIDKSCFTLLPGLI